MFPVSDEIKMTLSKWLPLTEYFVKAPNQSQQKFSATLFTFFKREIQTFRKLTDVENVGNYRLNLFCKIVRNDN